MAVTGTHYALAHWVTSAIPPTMTPSGGLLASPA